MEKDLKNNNGGKHNGLRGGRLRKIFLGADVFVLMFAVFVILDAFVIPKGQTAMTGNSSLTFATSTDDEEEDSGESDTKSAGETDSKAESTANAGENAAEVIGTYADDDTKITVYKYRYMETNVYVADVTVSSAEQMKRYFADATYGRNVKATTSEQAEDAGAVLAINGDYYGFRNKGYVVANGTTYRETSNSNEALVIRTDGTFEIVDEDEESLSSVTAAGDVWQVFSFGPALVEDGELSVDEDDEVAQSMQSNPRTAVGQVGALHYVFVVSDGRTSENVGLSLYELATFMRDKLGAETAYNLDGGGSSTMVFQGNVVNEPSDGHSGGEREVSDILYIEK